MSKDYITSDLHIGHLNCARWRGMTNEEHTNLIINNWNSTVTKYDNIYIVGDITMDSPKNLELFFSKVHGNIHVILGNHDCKKTVKFLCENNIPIYGSLKKHGYLITHIPVNSDELKYCKGNLHGHIHGDDPQVDLGPGFYNVNCEYHEFKPILISEVIKTIELQKDGK